MARAVILLLFVSVTGFFPLAFATPTDPGWIPGLYDVADYDDAVSLATSSEAGNLEIRVPLARPLVVVSVRASRADDSLPRIAPWSALRLRSPPLA